ncbi:bifunctional 3-phenylpropionate/cinnamic acid dioxygenase ferredoxin subunit [Streptomyces sp. NPDC004542]|uniref:bifunctional 3-phenylpropionate/cinnamic acid dioxygenase ferredoxin subunit n=1 Tax=Streptomyces sp. NPDC004542 TaxID=3154281 RepID=UPI0033B1EF5D
MAWVPVCSVGQTTPDEGYKIESEPPIAVFHVDGEFYAIDDTCSHGLSSLSGGYVDGCEVECVWHMARFDLRTGRAMCLPATKDVQTYPVKVDGDTIYLEVSDSIAATISEVKR